MASGSSAAKAFLSFLGPDEDVLAYGVGQDGVAVQDETLGRLACVVGQQQVL